MRKRVHVNFIHLRLYFDRQRGTLFLRQLQGCTHRKGIAKLSDLRRESPVCQHRIGDGQRENCVAIPRLKTVVVAGYEQARNMVID